jgi:cytochrome c553
MRGRAGPVFGPLDSKSRSGNRFSGIRFEEVVMQRTPALLAIALLGLTATAHGAGDPVAGKKKAQTCASCHGEQGNTSDSQYPKLAGQHASYLLHALKAYKSGERDNAVMAGLVENLSHQDLRDLAAYYASQDGDLQTPPRASADH